ncbi:pickpocket protein 28-like [Cochliomyia hominivorax]
MLTNKNENLSHSATDFLSVPKEEIQRNLSLTSQALSDVPSHVIIKTRIKYGDKWSACKGLWGEYTRSTSIHGLRYIFGVHYPFYERFYWIVLMLISLYFSIYFTLETYYKWLNSPVIMGLDETLVPIHKIPFPTITICPEIKMDTSIFDFNIISQQIWSEIEEYNKFQNLANLTEEELKNFAATLQLCESEVIDRFAPYLPKYIQDNMIQLLIDMSLIANDTLPFCAWNSYWYYGSNIIKSVLTDEGLCYQFNGLNASDIYRDLEFLTYADNTNIDYNNHAENGSMPILNEITGNWSLDDGYVGQGFNAYPQRTIYSSAYKGFIGILKGLEDNLDYTCRSSKLGYKVFLNSPESAPLTTGNYILMPHDADVLVSIIPEYVTTTDNLHKIGPEKRHCYFAKERYLRYFKSYSQSNCETECLSNFTINTCGCAKFWMPKPRDTPICGLADVECYKQAAEEMNSIIAEQHKQKLIDPKVKVMCDCLPSCNSLEYNFEISKGYLYVEKYEQAARETSDNGTHYSRLVIYYKERQFTAIKRTIIFDFTTLISHCGGIYNLFMGISGISLIEFLYFFTIRLIYNLRKRHRIEKRLMEEEKMENVIM